MRPGITVREALELPSLRSARLVAGRSGMERLIRYVNVMEVPDILPYVKEDELLLTTAYPIRDRPGALEELVPQLADRGLAALAVVPRPFLGSLSSSVLAESDRLGFPLIELPDHASFNDVMADVLDVILNRQAVQLERSRAIHEQLTAVVLAGGSLADLMRTLAQLLGDRVRVEDPSGQVLASSDDAAEAAPHERTLRPIRVGGMRLGDIVVAAEESALAPMDLIALDHAATIAALQLVQARSVMTREHRHRALLLDEIVSGHPIREEVIVEQAATLGWNLRRPRAAVVAEMSAREGGSELLVAGQWLEERVLSATRAALGDDAIAWGRRSGFAVLVPADGVAAARDDARRLSQELGHAVQGAIVSMGVGRVSPDVGQLHASYREATQALAIGRDLEGAGCVASFDELGLFRLLHPLSLGVELERYCADVLGPLLTYDRETKGELVKTLESYLRNGANAAVTARELRVHYNTLRYRLGKIDDLTGGLDRNVVARLSLEVALVGQRLLRSRGRPQAPDGGPRERAAGKRATAAGCRSGRAGVDRSSRRRSTSTR